MAGAARPRCTRCIPRLPTSRAPASIRAAFLERLAAAPLLYQPGTVWDYGLSIDVIGLVVEAISGQSLGAFLEQRLFRPLGMVDTSFQVPPDKVARLARPLPRDPDTGEPQSVPDRAQALRFECGGGGLASTALDYLRFAQMLLGGGVLGDTRILGRKTVEAMRTNRMTPDIENRIAELDPNSRRLWFRPDGRGARAGQHSDGKSRGVLLEWRLWHAVVGRSGGGPGGGLHGASAGRAAGYALPAAHQFAGLPGVDGITCSPLGGNSGRPPGGPRPSARPTPTSRIDASDSLNLDQDRQRRADFRR